MKDEPYLIQDNIHSSHNKIYSALDGRNIVDDIYHTEYNCKSLELIHDKEFHSDYRWNYRHKFANVKNH